MKRILVIFVAMCLLFSVAHAENGADRVYLALGDSITGGFGLREGELCFAEMLAEEFGYTLINEGGISFSSSYSLCSVQNTLLAVCAITLPFSVSKNRISFLGT